MLARMAPLGTPRSTAVMLSGPRLRSLVKNGAPVNGMRATAGRKAQNGQTEQRPGQRRKAGLDGGDGRHLAGRRTHQAQRGEAFLTTGGREARRDRDKDEHRDQQADRTDAQHDAHERRCPLDTWRRLDAAYSDRLWHLAERTRGIAHHGDEGVGIGQALVADSADESTGEALAELCGWGA